MSWQLCGTGSMTGAFYRSHGPAGSRDFARSGVLLIAREVNAIALP
jgi:hypothetical protein